MRVLGKWILPLAALFAGFAAVAAEKPTIRVGLTSAQSGQYADLASEFHTGVRAWVHDINERGSLLGRRVELVVYDDESNAERAARLYERLISEDQVDLLIGPFSSTLALAVGAVVEKHGFPMVMEATAPVVYDQGFKNVFGIYTPASHNMEAVLDIAAGRGMTRVGLAYQAAEFPEAVADGVRKSADGKGLDIVFDDSYAVGVDDLTGFVGKLAQSRPQVIVVGAYLDDAVLFTKALQKNGYAPEMIAFSGAPSLVEFGEALGTAADGVIATTQWMRDGRIPGAFDFGFRYRARFGRYPSYNAAGGYAAGQVLEAATRLAGTTDRAAVRKQLSQMNFHSLLGRYRVDDTGRQVGTPIYLVQWQDGHRSLVYPKDIARWELRFPFPAWDTR